jgi:hypothetical protein
MSIFLLILVVFSAFLPALLSFHRKVKHKNLLFFIVVLTNLQSVAILVIAALINPDIFDGPLFNYLILTLFYYLLIFLVYWVVISRMSQGNRYLNKIYTSRNSRLTKYIVASAIFFFGILVIHSDGIFLTNPRYGYQHFREGVGFIWVLYVLSISILYYFIALRKEINIKKVLFFILLFFFTGSKALILNVFISTFLVYAWLNKKISKIQIIFISFILVILMLKLFDQFGASQDFLTRASTYFDFMNQASRVFEDYDSGQLQHTNGEIFTSSFWSYVPRVLYPEKPYAYGSVTLVEMYYPGMAATGHTPSFGTLTPEFVDFGWFAPFFAVVFNLNLLVKIFAISVIVTNANIGRRWEIGAILFVFAPGFGFHLPIIFTLLVAFIFVPSLFKKIHHEKN